MGDGSIQQGVEFAPYSLATRELRATEGDSWSLLLFAFAYIFLMPWTVTLDFSPFIGTVVSLFFAGLWFNQASTGNSLVLNWRDRGFFAGTGYWLATRIQDLWIWSYRENRNVLSSVTGFNVPSSAFDVSKTTEGSNPFKVILEDWHDTSLARVAGKIIVILSQGRGQVFTKRFWRGRLQVASAPHSFFNSWMMGWVLLLSTLIAIRGQNADALGMMILFLWYAVGGVNGPMVKAQKKGHVVGRHGWGDIVAKWVGFVAAYGFLVALSFVGSNAAFAGSFQLSLVLGATILLLSETYMVFQQIIGNAHANGNLKWERLLSEGGRSFVTFVMMLGLLYFAPVPSVINIGHSQFIERAALATGLRWVAAAIFILVTLSKLIDVAQTSRLSRHYERLRAILHEMESADSAPPWALRSPIYSLLLEAYIQINRVAWRRAHQSLDKAEGLLPSLENWGLNEFGKKPSPHSSAPVSDGKTRSRLDRLLLKRRQQRLMEIEA